MESVSKSLVIIPAYNEEKNIAAVIENIRTNHGAIDIAVINDGSKDATSAIARNAGAVVIDLPFNLGYGAALQTGYKYAVEAGYSYVLQMDGDGQHDARSLSVLLEEIKKTEADVVIGSRLLGGNGYQATFPRRMGMKLFNAITSMILGQKITDSTSGYQAISRQVLDFYKRDIYPCDYPDADMLIMLHRAGFRIKEVPVIMLPNRNGKSMHGGLQPVYYIFKMFLAIFVTLLREKPASKGESPCL